MNLPDTYMNMLIKILDFTRDAFETYMVGNGVTPDYSPHSISLIDEMLSANLKIEFQKDNVMISDINLQGLYQGIGGYFGKTIVKNMNGSWVYPSIGVLFIGLIVDPNRHPSIGTYEVRFINNHIYVAINGKKIPVMKIARWRCNGSLRIKSLYEVYERIRTTGNWK